MTLKVKWVDSGAEPKNPPNPQFPDGVDLDISKGAFKTCSTRLPYPAKRIGYFMLTCDSCGMKGLISTAGRVDDPRSIKVACKLN
jgi:hypothetical protein